MIEGHKALSRNYFHIYDFLKEIWDIKVARHLLQETLPESLAKNIDWNSLSQENNATFDFRGMIYYCEIDNQSAYLMVPLIYDVISYPQLTAMVIRLSLKWSLFKTIEESAKLPVVIPIVLYCGEGFINLKSYPTCGGYGECFENQSLAEKYGMIKGNLHIIDLTTLNDGIWSRLIYQKDYILGGRNEAKKIAKRIFSLLYPRYNVQFIKSICKLCDNEILEVVNELKEENLSTEKMLEIASDLLENGIDMETIQNSTGLFKEEFPCTPK